VHRFSDVRQIEIDAVEPLGPDPSLSEDEIVIADLTGNKLPGSVQSLAGLIQAGGEILWSEIHRVTNLFWNKEELPDQWKEYIFVRIHKKGLKITAVIIVGYHRYQLHTKFCLIFFSQS
jgi:hypothetical protein